MVGIQTVEFDVTPIVKTSMEPVKPSIPKLARECVRQTVPLLLT